MQQVTQTQRSDPAPSRWAYRYQRLMLTPGFRLLLRAGLPFALSCGLGVWYLSDETRQEQITLAIADMREQIETRPEFMVRLLAFEGASDWVEAELREVFPYDFPASSFDLDLEALRQLIVAHPAVADASLRVRHRGVLVAEVTERQPVALWRNREGLQVVDLDGVAIAAVAQRTERADLPVVAGEGADQAIPEALAILAAAAPLKDRVRGLVRMGGRRWDLVLDRDQRILLPVNDPVRALERVIVLNDVQDMLERDLAAVDMRLAERPTIRMTPQAIEEWWRVMNISIGAE